jgi:hypothetical protein
MKGYEFTVYIKMEDGGDFLRFDKIIEAGIKALGMNAILEETDFRDTYDD